MDIKKNLKIEFRNKYTDKLRHLHIIYGDHEVRICDDLITFSCNLPKNKHEIGEECKKCNKRLSELVEKGVASKSSGRYEVVVGNIKQA